MQQVIVLVGCLAALLLASQVDAFKFESCDNGAGKLESIDIDGCDLQSKGCQFKVGDSFNITTNFITHNAFTQATIYLDAKTTGDNFVHVVKGPACELGLMCPSMANQTQSLALVTRIADSFVGKGPEFRFKLSTRIRDEFCVQFPLIITK